MTAGRESGPGALLAFYGDDFTGASENMARYTFVSRAWPSWARYLATVLIVCAMLALRLALGDLFQGYPFLFFFLAILASAALFNRGTGILAVLLSAVLAKWFLIPPTGTLNIATTTDVIALSSFIAVGLVSAAVLEALHRVASDLVEANQKLVASESEKDLLLQEASHRFKNELQCWTRCCACKSETSEIQSRVPH
jgi:two-component system, sensor histidine kinase PdtaS